MGFDLDLDLVMVVWFLNPFAIGGHTVVKDLRKQYKTKFIFSVKDRCTTQLWILNRTKLRNCLSNSSVLLPKVFTSLSLFLFEFLEDYSITQ